MGKNIIKTTGVILVINLIVKLLGFLRETFIAQGFGASKLTDAYFAAYTIPYFLQAILGFALVTAVVPILTKYLVNKDYEEAWHVGSSILNLTGLVLAALTVVGVVIAPVLVQLTAPGFDTELAAVTTGLTRIMFPSLICMGVGMVCTGILNANFRFTVGSFAPGVSNLIIILSVVGFASFGVKGLAVGTLISFLGFFLIHVPAVKHTGFKYQFVFDYKHPAVKAFGREIIPIVLGVAVNQIYFAINRIFASGMAEGSISVLNFASKLMNLPVGIFVAAVAAAIYPSLAENAIQNNKKALADTMTKGLSMVALISFPAAIGLMVLRVPIVQLLFERGAFDSQATLTTAAALLFFCVGLVPVAMNMIFTRAYYSLNDVKTPVVMGAISIVVNVGLSFLFLSSLQHVGLALANSIAAWVNALLLYIYLRRKLSPWNDRGFIVSLGKICVASVIMGVVTYVLWYFLGGFASGTIMLILIVGLCMAVAGIVYFSLAALLKIAEISDFINLIKKKLGKNIDNNSVEVRK